MPLTCPHCQRRIAIRDIPAPRFKTYCPGCRELLIVSISLEQVDQGVSKSAGVGKRTKTSTPAKRKVPAKATVASEVQSKSAQETSRSTSDNAGRFGDGQPEISLRIDPGTDPGTASNGEDNAPAKIGDNGSTESPTQDGDWLDNWLATPDPSSEMLEDPSAKATVDTAPSPDASEPPAKNAKSTRQDEAHNSRTSPTVDVPNASNANAELTADFNWVESSNESSHESPTADYGAGVASNDAITADDSQQETQSSGTTEFAPLATLPTLLGGYQIVEQLGAGAMGAVYLGKQLSLNRDVAVKVIQSKLAANPYYVARFTREAYAAAQLTHHNVVQIYDLGAARKLRFFSMEFVRGSDLGHVLREKGRLSPREAANYVLQAARGLKFAHDHGLIHRDIKPENLMLNGDGIVKVADLGLVKSLAADPLGVEESPYGDSGDSAADANAGRTMAHAAMGTPAYMPPEQAENAAGVDERADIYSLGCTLYTLLAGRVPFSGKTLDEVITKHKSGQFTPPKVAVHSLPEELSQITLKMMARRPEDRYRSMGEVIKKLMHFLGQGKERFEPDPDQERFLDQQCRVYRENALVPWRAKFWSIFALSCIFLIVIAAVVAGGFGVGVALGFAVLSPLAYFIYSGHATGGHVYRRFRQFLFVQGSMWWLKVIAGLAGTSVALYLLGWLLPWLVGAVLAVGLAAALYHLLDGQIARSRKRPLEEVSKLVRRMRRHGIDEHEIRMFLAETAGEDWEEIFEDLYGYEQKLAMRRKVYLPGQEKTAKKFRPWRDGMVRWLDSRIEKIKQGRDRRALEKVERARLRAQGMTSTNARQQAMEAADVLVDNAAQIRQAQQAGKADAATRRKMIKGMLLAARREGKKTTWAQRQWEGIGRGFDRVLGSTSRGLVGIALLVGCIAWMDANGLIPWRPLLPADVMPAEASELHTLVDAETLQPDHVTYLVRAHSAKVLYQPEPLVVSRIPRRHTAIFYSYGAGIAGVFLVLASLAGGRWTMAFILPAVYILIFGPFMGIPEVDFSGGVLLSKELASYAVGGLLGVIGLVVGMRR